MATLNIPDDLFAQLQAKAIAAGKPVEEFAIDGLRESVKETITEMGERFRKKYAGRVKYTPEQVPDLVREYRSGHER